jgi:hypothetical protein
MKEWGAGGERGICGVDDPPTDSMVTPWPAALLEPWLCPAGPLQAARASGPRAGHGDPDGDPRTVAPSLSAAGLSSRKAGRVA